MAEIKSPEEVLKDVYEHHKNNVLPDENWASWEQCKKDGTIYMVVSAMEAYHAQFTHAGKGVEEAAERLYPYNEAIVNNEGYIATQNKERVNQRRRDFITGASFNQAQFGCGLRWVKCSDKTFEDEDWQNNHLRYRQDKMKLDAHLFEVRFDALRKIGGEGWIPFDETEYLSSTPCPCERYREALQEAIEYLEDGELTGSYVLRKCNEIITDALTQQ